MPEISVIVPVYKVEKYIHRCVDSILNQTFTDFELILVDDGSPDKCGAICDEYARKDSRVVVIHQENGGLSAARNAGIDWAFANSDSEWITFIDSDDWVHPQFLEYLLRAAEGNSVKISVCGIARVNHVERMENKRDSSHIKKSEDLYLDYAMRPVNVSACGKLYHKTCFETIRYPVGKLWEDLATTYKLILSVPECAIVDEPLYYYFLNPDGIIRRLWTPSRLDEFEAYETQLKFFEQEKKWEKIYEALQLTYVKAISYSYYMCRESQLPPEEKKYYLDLLSRKMRNALKKNRKKPSFSEHKGVYETAFPRAMTVYWTVKSVLKKLGINRNHPTGE